ncbi:hypothetical protein [Salipiger thiooxidans]|uniref:hypothetical protein n=1 Tax=Salipiger thiooxidans TaxID=282683 RepID=UPI001CD314B4|nr:hypothetical protein [Salipiger thiooxidans]MCA0851407.1 hypothetical protein [Salipiger thiooxidans]
MPGKGKVYSRSEDERLLKLLHYRDNEGMSLAAAAKMVGMSRGAAIGQAYRVREREREFEEDCARRGVPVCACLKPENCDGGMPARWWNARA